MKNRNFQRAAPAFLLALALAVLASGAASAADAAWSALPMPRSGVAGGWTLTPGSDVGALAADSQGRLLVWLSGADGGLFHQAAGGGFGKLYSSPAEAVALGTASDGRFYYATSVAVYRSEDGGQNFITLPSNPGGAGAGNRRITGMEVISGGSGNAVAVSVADSDAGEWGGVYVFNEADFFSGWRDISPGASDVLHIMRSPSYAADGALLALAVGAAGTSVIGYSGGGWSAIAGAELRHGSNPVFAAEGRIAATPDYNLSSGAGQLYAAVSNGAGGGGVWAAFLQRAPGSSPSAELGLSGDFASIAASGAAPIYTVVVGAAASGHLFCSSNGGSGWAQEAAGGDRINSIMASGGKYYAATAGSGSALCAADTNGRNWGQAAFIDGAISAVVDLAVSPSDGAVYLLSFNSSGSSHDLWRSADLGASWRHLLGTGDYGLGGIERMAVAGDGTIFIAGPTAAGPVLLESKNSGLSFSAAALPQAVDSTAGFAAADAANLFYASLDSFARVWRRTASGGFESAVAGAAAINAIEISPSFDQDRTLVAGASDGNIFLSTDGGASFGALPRPAISGDIYLAFAPDFSTSRRIYSASRDAGAGIWQLTLGESGWSRIDSGLPSGFMVSGLSVSPAGVIYAASANQVTSSAGGLARKSPDYAAWDSARSGLPAGVTLWGMEMSGDVMFSLDTANSVIVTFTDTLAAPVQLVSPPDKAPGLGIFGTGAVGGIDLTWRNPGGAALYEWQVSDRADMSSPRFSGTSPTESIRLSNLDAGAAYYWRVRVTLPLPGPWSAVRSFTAALGGVTLLAPGPGAGGVAQRPVFQWTQTAAATGYQLVIAADAGFTSSPAEYSIAGNAWQPVTELGAGMTYFWKVRALGPNTFSAWSGTAAFTTAAAATPSQPPPGTTQEPIVTTQVIVQTAVPEWVTYAVIGFGGLTVVLLIVVIATVRSRPKFF
ncbi:WD40 repeat domain-containing protein [Dehalogenimonas sp. 4OHTPN]|uniref:WD40 repeat domain-containing protein n=1 Tax=Dehalogenimonas sp. 4OHTPN TaxID=3166643 RepID=A0AAU8GAD7_9CHLR